MVPKKDKVNDKQPELGTVYGRLTAERQRLKMSQTDLRMRMGVGKTTQFKYETG